MAPISDPTTPAVVYVLAESRLIREFLAGMLQKRHDVSVAGASGSRDLNLDHVAAVGCNVILMDRLHETSLLESLRKGFPVISIVLFGMDDHFSTFLGAIRLGVCGYLLNDASASEIVAAVRAVAQGEAVCPPKLCRDLLRYVARQPGWVGDSSNRHVSLTCRQSELISLVAKGLTNKQIAASLNLSAFTVRNHIRRIMQRTEAEDRHHAVRMVRARGVELHS